ncbi:tumor necrosis factor receptor superfamily member 5 isoform X2 [Dunckerocampus dactyliophorus]|uniref:tumor necrosis factor receptor superfamily member 5 isoform X2 n=1 Tax=Dunckerocampus dactyliophorus TaxID=161453 RepID=UPI002405506C|nr:tumor necrosis factor receptor superfamily member 5 isoform X2 [Dunckerocampus dactyliophorus]
MGLKVQYLVSVLFSSAQLLLTIPLPEKDYFYIQQDKACKMCPPGEFQKSCEQCEPCPAWSYTTNWNAEDSCHRCYGDCRPEFNQKVIENCTSRSNLKCACQAGFRCTEVAPYSQNCRNCVKIRDAAILAATTTTTTVAAVTSDEDKQTPSSADSSISARLCFPECDARHGNNAHINKERNTIQLVAIVCPVVVLVTVSLAILFCICRPEDETCLKRAVVKLHNKGGGDAAGQETEEHFPIEPSGAVHVHNAGTVIFSWLSHFTGQVGPVMEARRVAGKEEDEEDQAPPTLYTQPVSSPSLPLSEEERSSKVAEVFFPSQEEGKEWHVSKEEVF